MKTPSVVIPSYLHLDKKIVARARVVGVIAIGILIALLARPAGAHEHPMESMPMGTRLGRVSFPIACDASVQESFNRAIALLHSFWYQEAERAFERVAHDDPQCAMAYWGEALLNLHEINSKPNTPVIQAGEAMLARADAATHRAAHDLAYVRALHAFYDGDTTERFFVHAKAYADAMGDVSKRYPDDLEAKVFYALSLIGADPPDDVSLAYPKKAVAILLPLFKLHPDHPGIAHYIIHACDNPEMAREGLEAARRYAMIAPAAPHALHMPGHIFARLGLWQEDIQSNLASKAASENTNGVRIGAENRLHAMEFLEYAYLQTGEDDKARAIIAEAKVVPASEVDPAFPDYYGVVEARYPALYAIETRDWTMAAHLLPIATAGPRSQGLTFLAHVISAAHRGNEADAAAAVEAFDRLASSEHLAPALHDEIHAWGSFAHSDFRRAEHLLRTLAERQAKVGKGEVELPAREMLADMLALRGDTREALREYQKSLVSDPNRFDALLGAGMAAQKLGDRAAAQTYFRQLIDNCPTASGPAAAIVEQARSTLRVSGHG